MKAFDNTGGDMRDNNESRITKLEAVMENINETLRELKYDIKSLDKKFDTKFDYLDKKIDSKFETSELKIQTKLDRINNRIWFNFYWGVGGIGMVLGVLAHALKWIP